MADAAFRARFSRGSHASRLAALRRPVFAFECAEESACKSRGNKIVTSYPAWER